MKITVLPVRDRPEKRPRARPEPAPPRPTGEIEGLPSTGVELRAECRRPPLPTPRVATRVQTSPAVPALPPVPVPVPVPGATAVEIALPNGRIVRVPPGFAAHDLERALAIASGEAPPAPAPVPPSGVPKR